MDPETDFEDLDTAGSINGLEAEFIDVNGIRTRYYEAGEGESVLLLHGGGRGGSGSANMWSRNIDDLAETFHVLAPDRLSAGMTDNPPEREWNFQGFLDHVVDFIRSFDIERFHVMGQSAGMAPAAYLALEYPDMVKSLVVLNSRTLAPDAGDYGQRRSLMHSGVQTNPEGPSDLESAIRSHKECYSYTTDHVTDEYVHAGAYMASQPKSKKAARMMVEDGLEEKLRDQRKGKMDAMRSSIRSEGLSIPTLLFWGRHDPSLVLDQAIDLYEMISQTNPNVRLYLVDRAGHYPHRESPAEFAQITTAFMTHWADRGKSMEEVRPQKYREYHKSSPMYRFTR
ncbi:alpha/beta hydrolase [Halobellus captivus]|uniref:alpha/beta hydrolase n=1 Tax=Halobellus captivus TaxID=2592614 RepID=UPI0011A2E0A1|nr:alpha/beta hydrolase [Halobellus captivus]